MAAAQLEPLALSAISGALAASFKTTVPPPAKISPNVKTLAHKRSGRVSVR